MYGLAYKNTQMGGMRMLGIFSIVAGYKAKDVLQMNSDERFIQWVYEEMGIPEWQYNAMSMNERLECLENYRRTLGKK